MIRKNILLLAAFSMVLAANAQTPGADSTVYSNDGRHSGLDFNINTGYHVGVGDYKGGGSIPVELGLGKQFSRNLYAGLGSGVWIGTKGSKPMVPIMADLKAMFPSRNAVAGSVKPFISLRLGYLLNTEGSQEIEAEGFSTSYDPADFILMEITPGVQFPLTAKSDFLLSAGYTHGFATKGGGGGGYFTVKVGLNFHRNFSGKRKPKVRRPKEPTRDHGFQFTLEGSVNYLTFVGGGGNVAFTYKLNPHFSVGLGGGVDYVSPFESSAYGDVHVIRNGSESHNSYDYNSSETAYHVFARGVYRMSDRRCSPFVSLDAGVRIYSWDKGIYEESQLSATGVDMFDDPQKTYLFASPAIGYSFRTTNNSYLDVKVGYTLSPNLKGQKKWGSHETGGYYYIASKSKRLSYPFLSIGFTHTFGKKTRR